VSANETNAGAGPGRGSAVGAAGGRAWDRALVAAAAVLAFVWVGRLGAQAAGAVFGTDECFHAWLSGWIAAHGRLPDSIPGLYGGFDYSYPPLLHVAGAAAVATAGEGALRFLSLACAAGTLLAVAFAAPGAIPGRARAWAVLLCVASGLYASYAVRLYAESLSALAVTAGGLAFVHQQRAGGRFATLLLGVVAGFAILAKFAGGSVPALVAAGALVRLARGETASARGLLLALAIALAVAAPWLIRNQILFGSPLYPFGASAADSGLLALHVERFSVPPVAFLSGMPRVLGPWLPAMVAVAALALAIERRWQVRESLWAFALAGMVATAFVPPAAARHLVAFLPLLALASSWIVADSLVRRGIAAWPAGAALVAVAAWALVRMPDHRAGASPPPALMDAFAAVARVTPERANVLSLWTYDTFYHAGRAATWPVPWGQARSPAPLFRTDDPLVFAATLDSLGITHVLAPRSAPLEPWNGSNYPESFVACARALMERGGLHVAWQSERFVLLRRE
jgi:hypothetical protein